MKNFLKRSWILIAAWVLIIVIALMTMPNMSQLVQERDKQGQDSIGSSYQSSIAQSILKKYDQVSTDTKEVSLILVYNSEEKLTEDNKASIKEKIDGLENDKQIYGIVSIKNLFTNTDLADELISADQTTLLIPITVNKGVKTVDDIRDNIKNVMAIDDLELTTTGSDFVIQDFFQNMENGVQKTEIITIVFIFMIMLLIFRSPVTPFATLATVGFSYIVALNMILWLVSYFNFPISSFTKVFLIIILFGIGTDYTLLLLMRYREELLKGVDIDTAIVNSYTSAGKTVLISSITIIIGFACLFFVEFNLYKSASAVAIGIVIFLIILFTFLPGVMKLLGNNLFWSPLPSKGHSESKLWESVSRFSTRFPVITLMGIGAVCCLIFFYNGSLSFNNINEVSDSSPSVIGYDVISSHFSSGKTMPVTIVIESENKMDNQSDLAALDSLTESIKSVDGVDVVYSVTQPKGKKIKNLYLNNQIGEVIDGIDNTQGGISQIREGLQGAVSKLNASSSDAGSLGELSAGMSSLVSGLDTAKSSSQQLSAGLTSLKTGSSSLSSNLGILDASCSQLSGGLSNAAEVSAQINQGIKAVNSNLSSMGIVLDTMSSNVSDMKTGLTDVGTNFNHAAITLNGVGTNLNAIASNTQALSQQLESSGTETELIELNNIAQNTQTIGTSLNSVNNDLTQVEETLTDLSAVDVGASLSQAQTGLETMSAALIQIESASSQLSSGLISAADAEEQISAGMAQLSQGGQALDRGLVQLSDGQDQITDGLSTLSSGSKQIQDGQNQLIDKVEQISSQITKLISGLNDAINGLDQINNGINSVDSYLNGLRDYSGSESVFYIPKDEINGSEFSKSVNNYMSENRTISLITVTLSVDPYSKEAMDIVDTINQKVETDLDHSSLKVSQWGISGATQTNIDLRTMSDKDFTFARIIMLLGIFIVLVFIMKDLWIPSFVMASLVASYYIAISLSHLIFVYLLNLGDLSWNVPFCSFIMIVSLGVDYSIFLIMRHQEITGFNQTESIVIACKKVGAIIASAAFILAGTFAALYPSGVMTLMEISVTVIIGIAMLSLVFVPIFIPTMIALRSKRK